MINEYMGIDDLAKAVGTTLGQSSWFPITQRRIDLFAEATNDHQWLHTDPAKAAAGPFGSTIAHGYLTLSLIPAVLEETVRIAGLKMAVNYGTNRVRFPAPIPVNSDVRGTVKLLSLEEKSNGTQAIFVVTIDRKGTATPVCIAEVVSLFVH